MCVCLCVYVLFPVGTATFSCPPHASAFKCQEAAPLSGDIVPNCPCSVDA